MKARPFSVCRDRSISMSDEIAGRNLKPLKMEGTMNSVSFLRQRRPLCLALLALLFFGSVPTASADIRWHRSPEEALNAARTSGKPIIVFVGTDWCHYCTKMKKETWQDPITCQHVSPHFETLYLDGDRDAQIVSRLQVRGYPATLVYTSEGEFLQQADGYLTVDRTIAWLRSIASNGAVSR